MVFAEDMNNAQPSNPNDVMQTVPHEGNPLTVADASSSDQPAMDSYAKTTHKAVAPKVVKKKHKKHCGCSKKRHCKVKKHHHKVKHTVKKPAAAANDEPSTLPATQ